MTKRAYQIFDGTKIKHENGLNYQVYPKSENRNGKIKFLLVPYQNSMSASKSVTVSENYEFNLI